MGRGSCTLGRVKAWAWCESEVSAVVCLEAVTEQFVQTPPGERQLFGALLVGSRIASKECCLSPSLPSASVNSLPQRDCREARLPHQGGHVLVSV